MRRSEEARVSEEVVRRQGEPDPALARRQRQQQAETGHGRPERAPGQHRRAVTPPPQRDCVEAVR